MQVFPAKHLIFSLVLVNKPQKVQIYIFLYYQKISLWNILTSFQLKNLIKAAILTKLSLLDNLDLIHNEVV